MTTEGGGDLDLGNLSITLQGTDAGFSKMIQRAEAQVQASASKLEKISAKLEAAGNKMVTHVTLPLLAMRAATVAAFAQFDDAMTRSLARFGPAADGMRGGLEATAKQIAGSSLSSATDLAKAYETLADAGMSASNAQAGLATVEKFSVATGMDAARAAGLVAQAQRQLGLTADDAATNTANLTRLEDELLVTSKLSGSSVEELGEALEHKGGAALRRFNIPLERGLGLLAMFAQQGRRGARAGAELADYLQSHTGEVPIAGGLEAAIGAAGGETTRRAAKVMESFSSQVKVLANNTNLLAVEVGGALVPHLQTAIDWVKSGTEWFRSLSASQRETAVTLGMVAAGIGPALKGLTFLGRAGVASLGAITLVPAAVLMIFDAIGVTNTGVLDMVEGFRIGGKKISTYMDNAAAHILGFVPSIKAIAHAMRGDWGKALDDLNDLKIYSGQIDENNKADADDLAKQQAKHKKEEADLQAKINGLAASNPAIPMLDLELKKTRELKAEQFSQMSLRRFSLAGFAYAQPHGAKAAAPSEAGTAAGSGSREPGAVFRGFREAVEANKALSAEQREVMLKAISEKELAETGVTRGSGAMNRITASDIGVTKGGHRQTLQNRKGDPWALDEDRRLAMLKAKERYDNVGDVPIDTRGEQMLKYLIPRGGIAAGVQRPKSFTNMPTEFAREASYSEMSRTKDNASGLTKADAQQLGCMNTFINIASETLGVQKQMLTAMSQGPRLAR